MIDFSSKGRLWQIFACFILWGAVGCSPHPEKVGDECEVDGDPCPKGSLCVASGDEYICQAEIDAGGACKPGGPDLCKGDLVCGDNHDGTATCGLSEGATCDAADDKCAGGLSCAELQAGGFACYPPVLIKGMVFDSSTTAGIADAQVLALDDLATAV